MSERVFEGAATVRQLPQSGMITVRGDMGDLARAVTVPDRGMIKGDVAWMSPDELMVLTAHEDVSARVSAISDAMAGLHHLVQDVSDARALFQLSGAGAGEALAKLCPVDIAAMTPGRFRRTRLAQVPCAVWMGEDDTFTVMVFSSVADYAWNVLSNAAATPVGHFA